ncbi:MAG: choice-of-anchor X domain-containing protein [Terriglobales bacterium]
MKRIWGCAALIFATLWLNAQDSHVKSQAPIIRQSPIHFGDSPFDPPDKNDKTFTVDTGSGLDTGCTFRSGGPLIIHVSVDRVVGDVAKLKANGLISPTARLEMPAFDVDFDTPVPPPFQPERDRVSFNGHVVPGEFLTGLNDTWVMNRYDVPIEWVNFPDDPGHGGTLTPADNTIQIDIDTANPNDELWCTSIDWAALSVEVARPVVMVHGILSSGGTWSSTWVPNLNNIGLPDSNALNMGNLDSIGNNATKIANEVSSSKQRWGVDKVNIVAHSKGGIDSREYVESSSSVDQLIQIGTPNAGSPLADDVQGGLLGATGLVGSVIVNSLAGPAGVQLTRPYMGIYNLTHGSNPNVAYTSLVGLYHPRLLLDPIDSLLAALVGPGDTIVPVTSVFALPYASHLTFESSGADKQAVHTQQTSSQGIYNALSGRVQQLALLNSNPQSPVRTTTIIKNITQGAVQTTTISVDQATPVVFGMMYPSGDLDLSVTSPSGQMFTAANVSGNPTVTQEKKDILGGFFEIFRVANPEAGNWTLQVTGTSVIDPSGVVAYSVTAWIENASVMLVGGMEKSTVHAGDSLRLLATLTTGGLPLPGPTATARILLPDGSISDVTLHDDGVAGDSVANDGIYSAIVGPLSQAGIYQVLFRAIGTAPGSSAGFSREDYSLATVSSSSSFFDGTFHDAGVDTDGDGLFNLLNIDVGLNITTAATYRIVATLTDSSGNTLDAPFKAALAPGLTTVHLSFDGSTIFGLGINGPYKLSHIILAEESARILCPLTRERMFSRRRLTTLQTSNIPRFSLPVMLPQSQSTPIATGFLTNWLLPLM